MGRTGRLYNFKMEGNTESLRIVSECGELMNRDELRDYGDLMYLTEKKKYSVCKDGRIKESKIGKERVEAVPQKDGIVKPVTFDEYLNLFIPLESDKVSEETFFRYDYKEPGCSYQKELEYSYRKAFLPDSIDCDCMPRNSIWSPKYRLESEKYITVFFENFCDYPKGPSPFFTDRVIATYSKDGRLIDIRDIARYGDYWEPQIDDSSTLSSITVRQGFIDEKTLNQPVKSVKVVVSRHGVMPDGKIHSETVETYQTTDRWDEKKNQIVF
ncbi:MAG: hypothetical protein LUD00_05120 [Prevotellaceae bacterium]|nr:hypothetical protein [Prevotellaceae bacterium]